MPDETKFHGCEMQRLELKPGDRFVLTSERPLAFDQVARIRDAWAKFWTGHSDIASVPPVFFCDGMRLSIVSVAVDEGAVEVTSPGQDGGGHDVASGAAS